MLSALVRVYQTLAKIPGCKTTASAPKRIACLSLRTLWDKGREPTFHSCLGSTGLIQWLGRLGNSLSPGNPQPQRRLLFQQNRSILGLLLMAEGLHPLALLAHIQ